MEVWFFFDEGTTGREPQMSGEETERIYTRAPPKRVGRALALLTKTYHGSRVTGQWVLVSDYGVISNDAGRFKRFYFLFFLPTNTPLPWHASCVSVIVLFLRCVTLTARPMSASSIRFCLPNISSATIDHDALCDFPEGRRVA
jgi:hypothetical protein